MGDVKKILLLSSSDDNGAHLYVVKVAEVLLEMGHEVKMLVKRKTQKKDYILQYQYPPVKESFTEKITWRIREKIKPSQPLHIIDGEYAFISVDEQKINTDPEEIIRQIGFKPDFIFSGMTNLFMSSRDIRNLQKICGAQVYTMMVDMNHLTGGCHFAWDCGGYIKGCPEYCPAIGDNPRAKINFETKYRNATEGDWKCIASSSWTQKQIEQSKIYGRQQEPYNFNSVIDTGLLNAKNKDIAKRVFNLEADTFYILCGAQSNNLRKGFEYLNEAIEIFAEQYAGSRKASLLLVSHVKNSPFDEISINKAYLPFIHDYRLLSLLYQAADVFVNSSIEDSGPMMVSEALASGTPVVGFDMGVVNNMVITGYNGYRAELRNSADLAKGIHEIYTLDAATYQQYSQNAVQQVEAYSSYSYVKKELERILN